MALLILEVFSILAISIISSLDNNSSIVILNNFAIGPSITCGYDFANKEPEFIVGFSITYLGHEFSPEKYYIFDWYTFELKEIESPTWELSELEVGISLYKIVGGYFNVGFE